MCQENSKAQFYQRIDVITIRFNTPPMEGVEQTSGTPRMRSNRCGSDLARLLPDYFTGHLSAEHGLAMERHLEFCRACQRSLELMGLLTRRGGDEGSTDVTSHISAKLLVQYYQAPDTLDKAISECVEAHLRSCSACAYEMNFLTELERDLREALERPENS